MDPSICNAVIVFPDMAVSAVTPSTVRELSFPADISLANDGSSETSYGVISLPSTLFSTALDNRGQKCSFVSNERVSE